MSEEMTLGYMKNDGSTVNLHIGIRDWGAQCALVEDLLHTYHIQMGNTDADVPSDRIINAVYCVRNMRDGLMKLEAKADMLIEENMELQNENELLRKELKAHGLLGTQEAPPEGAPQAEIQK